MVAEVVQPMKRLIPVLLLLSAALAGACDISNEYGSLSFEPCNSLKVGHHEGYITIKSNYTAEANITFRFFNVPQNPAMSIWKYTTREVTRPSTTTKEKCFTCPTAQYGLVRPGEVWCYYNNPAFGWTNETFVFDRYIAPKTVCENVSVGNELVEEWYYDWVPVTGLKKTVVGENTLYTYINAPLVAGEELRGKFEFDTTPRSAGKFDTYIWTDTGIKISLDPWWDTYDFGWDNTSAFDSGTKSDIETVTDYIEVPADSIRLKLGVNYSENFDAMANATLPTSWKMDSVNSPLRLLTSDTHYSTADEAMWQLANTTGYSWKSAWHNQTYNETYNISAYAYTTATTHYYIMLYVKTGTAGWTGGNVITPFYLTNAADIKMYNGTVLTDTGTNFASGSMKKYAMQLNTSSHKFDAWYEGTQVANDWGFYSTSANEVQQVGFATNMYGPSQSWADDIKLGGYYRTGNWTSPVQEVPAGSQLYSFTLNYSGATANTYIDEVEFLVGGVDVANYTTDITSDTTITVTAPSYGTFADVDENFTVRVYLVGNTSDTPVVTMVAGMFWVPSEGEYEFKHTSSHALALLDSAKANDIGVVAVIALVFTGVFVWVVIRRRRKPV